MRKMQGSGISVDAGILPAKSTPGNKVVRTAQPAFPVTRKLDLTNARAAEPWNISGDSLYLIDETDASVRIYYTYEPNTEPIPLPRGSFLGELRRFETIFITHAASPGNYAWLTAGTGLRGW